MTYQIPETLMANLLSFLQRNSTGNDEADTLYQELTTIKKMNDKIKVTLIQHVFYLKQISCIEKPFFYTYFLYLLEK